MEIFNIGPMELILVVLLMIILVGPIEMIRLTRRTGALIRSASQSSFWKEVSGLKREIRQLPFQMAREAGIEEIDKDLRESTTVSLYQQEKPSANGTAPGEVRSPGRGKLRPPAPRGYRPAAVNPKPAGTVDASPATAVTASAAFADNEKATNPSADEAADSKSVSAVSSALKTSVAVDAPHSTANRTHLLAGEQAAAAQDARQDEAY